MKLGRSLLLTVSLLVSALVLGGGLFVKVRADETSYKDAVIFAEILSLVMENYVDPVESENLMRGAYEGLLVGLDPNGAYLSPVEVKEWKSGPVGAAGPGLTVLKLGRSLQVVGVAPGSSAADAGIVVGDQVRTINGREVNHLSLGQCRRLLAGASGTTLRLDLLKRNEEFREDKVELERGPVTGPPYTIDASGNVAVLHLKSVHGLDPAELAAELDDVASNGQSRLLIDVRNLADEDMSSVAAIAALFTASPRLLLKDRDGEVVNSVEGSADTVAWTGSVTLLANGATAGAGEALTRLLQTALGAELFGEPTFGLGAEPELLELDNGSGLLVSVARWETAAGESWNEDGIEPDQKVSGDGDNFTQISASQLEKVLQMIDGERGEEVRAA